MSAVKIQVPENEKLAKITLVMFGERSRSEIAVLSSLYRFSEGLGLYLDGEVKIGSGVSDSAFNTAIHRLCKAGIIAKKGASIRLHPIYKAMNCNQVILDFSPSP